MKHPGTTNLINDEKKIFKWTDENLDKIKNIVSKYPKGRQQSAVIPVLDLAQRQNNGWLTKNIIEKVSDTLGMSFIRVMEVATFYSMFNLQPVAKNFIQVCRTTPCWLRGSNKLVKIAKEVTGCDIGETSEDKIFTLVEVECLGACCNAPMVQINDDYYEDLNEQNFKELLLKIKNNEKIVTGSQIGRKSSEARRN
tara:strand:- start:477 stop:1064 length:588 start_codon:yes stop_codon:yes gene_type:complete